MFCLPTCLFFSLAHLGSLVFGLVEPYLLNPCHKLALFFTMTHMKMIVSIASQHSILIICVKKGNKNDNDVQRNAISSSQVSS